MKDLQRVLHQLYPKFPAEKGVHFLFLPLDRLLEPKSINPPDLLNTPASHWVLTRCQEQVNLWQKMKLPESPSQELNVAQD